MKNYNNKDISISDLANEFHVSKSSLELYGIHKLLLPIPDQKSKPAYRPIDKARLKFITRAKNANYTIGNIKELIGVLDLDKNEVDQIEESLVYCKKKAAVLKDGLEDLDALEQINATCDLELLEPYITDLNNLKYGLDITPIKTALPEPDTQTSHAKPRTLVYSHISDQIDASAPTIAPKKSRMPLFVVAGIFLVAITGYLYLGGDLVPDISNNLVVTPQVDPAEMTATAAAPNETDEIYLSETDTIPDETGEILGDKPDSTETSFSLLDLPALENKLNPPSSVHMGSRLETDSDEQAQDTETNQALLDIMNEFRETTPKPDPPVKEETDNIFLKQLVADLKKKYDEQAQSQKPATNDITEIDADPEKVSENNETQNLAAVVVSNNASQTNKTTAVKTKTSPIQTDTAQPDKVAPAAVNQEPISSNTSTSSSNAGAPVQSAPGPKPASPTIQTGSSTQQTTTSTKKAETSTQVKRSESASKTITPPEPKPKAKPETKPEPTPKPKTVAKPEPKNEPEPKPKLKTIPQKPANPEALKWAQKSYESVMSGDAGGAIISASVAITLDPNLVNAYINRSWAYSKKGLYDRAIQDCDKALTIDNDNALAYNNRGLAFQGKGDIDKAKADYDRACKLGFDLGCKNYQEVINLATK